uniref:CASP-like protein n=1 Tax=Nelumbo nucifera TaxID=4432 RepID=A0A822Y4E6_NELNU|nr:TPA_asm: hypothetical protein HUJ06_027657 [Nelumbo nucifera]
MNASHPAVHPVEAPPLTDAANNVPRVRMKDIQGMPGTLGGVALRISQFLFAVAALCVMASTNDFTSVTAFCYLVAAVSLQSVWSLSLAFVDIYALLVKRCLRNSRIVSLFTIGDGPVHQQELLYSLAMILMIVLVTTVQGSRQQQLWLSSAGLLFPHLFS